jgi:hypothetical protein
MTGSPVLLIPHADLEALVRAFERIAGRVATPAKVDYMRCIVESEN